MSKYKIAWQKYEDYLEKQISSPMLDIISNIIAERAKQHTEEGVGYEDEPHEESRAEEMPTMVPISPQLIEDIAVLSSYECWIGHTNFDVTKDIKNILDKIEGVEMLRILSRYRFFIGLGKLFEFKQVRKNIESNIIPE